MEALRIKNLRCLQDTGLIELRPITILLGQNSSGKSTFLRALPLLRQTVEARTRSPLLWFGRLVDFGGFADAVFSKSSPKEIAIGMRLSLEAPEQASRSVFFEHVAFYRRSYFHEQLPRIPAIAEVRIAYDGERDIAFTRAVEISVAGHALSLQVTADGRVEALLVNKHDFRAHFSEEALQALGSLSPIVRDKLHEPSQSPGVAPRHKGFPSSTFVLAKFVQSRMHGNTSFSTALSLVRRFNFGTGPDMLQQAKKVFVASSKNRVAAAALWSEMSPEFIEFRDLLVAVHLVSILETLNERIANTCRTIRYIEPLRATADRFYRFQDLAVDEIDSQGQNLPMFIHALSTVQLAEFQGWTQKHFGFSIKPDRHAGHLSLLVAESQSRTHNLADSGFGYSQILPIATQLWWQARESAQKLNRVGRPINDGGILAMEQPELHLHPRLQTQIADTFVAAVELAGKNGNPFCIVAETHSEAIVNRLGELIAGGVLRATDVNVVLFEREDADTPSKVRCAHYDENGYLQNWPHGFFNATAK